MKFMLDKFKCTGCNACVSVCPKQAIVLAADQYGFNYPQINELKCIDCGMCNHICPINQNTKYSDSQIAYAATNKNNNSIEKSSSGGIFYTLAKKVIEECGIVFGTNLDDNYNANVIAARNLEDIQNLVGSKYVQSNMKNSLKEIKELLKAGNFVMFCGTPCQVAAVKSFVGEISEKLLLVDIVCHGVPNNNFFKDYIASLENSRQINIRKFFFRDKKYGQDTRGLIVYKKDNKTFQKCLYPFESSYYNLFLKGITFRDCCYQCAYASEKRIGDITICDFWGIDEECPDIYEKLRKNGAVAISGVIISSDKGNKYFEKIKEELLYERVDYECIKKHNPQLIHAFNNNEIGFREILFDAYRNHGYDAVEKLYYKHYRKYIILKKISRHLPMNFKKLIVRILGSIK